MKELLKSLPVVGPVARRVARLFRPAPAAEAPFERSDLYWDRRYRGGGNSGKGSYDHFATFKAEVLNDFVRERGVTSVIEFGCGDGNQLTLAEYPSYLGHDVSEKAVELCRERFAGHDTKSFVSDAGYDGQTADLALSLDVIYHLVEDAVFEAYMARLFDAAGRFVVIYSSNTDDNPDPRPDHVRDRRFTDWVTARRPGWKLARHLPNRYPHDPAEGTGSRADFFFFERDPAAAG